MDLWKPRTTFCLLAIFASLLQIPGSLSAEKPSLEPAANRTALDHIRKIQTDAIQNKKSPLGHWGNEPDNYTAWGTHSNRLIPIYTFGTREVTKDVTLKSYLGENSPYRTESGVKNIFGRLPTNTVNSKATYCDQTNLAEIQFAALKAGKKHIFLVVFDGMDWESTRNASIYKTGKVDYCNGRGSGLHFQNYRANGNTEFGFMVTTPHSKRTKTDVNEQTVSINSSNNWGGYNVKKGGENPWTLGNDGWYLMGLTEKLTGKKGKKDKREKGEHAVADSAGTATALTAGVKTYNGSIGVNPEGQKIFGIAHEAQKQGYAVGTVTSVPISHATPASAYANNVNRNDYQDITRDMLGLPSISHPKKPLPGLDVVIGCGMGSDKKVSPAQGRNFVPGNQYLTNADRANVDYKNGGKYTVAIRTDGADGGQALKAKAVEAVLSNTRLLGFFGGTENKKGKVGAHLPYQTANGDYQPAPGRRGTAEEYTPADIKENPTLAEMTEAAILVLSQRKKGFWLMVESGDVDWANHNNNIDNSIGAVLSGDDAVKVITNWVEKNSNWEDSLLIVTADHGHYFQLKKPNLLTGKTAKKEDSP